MKKLKWILLFIMILLASVFLFATCKKTKAYEPGEDYHKRISITDTDSNSDFLMVNVAFNYCCSSLIDASTSYMYIVYSQDANNYSMSLYHNSAGLVKRIQCPINDYVASFHDIGMNEQNLAIMLGLICYDRVNDNYYYNTVIVDDSDFQAPTDWQPFDTAYHTSAGLIVYNLYSNPNFIQFFTGAYNYWIYDALDYSTTMSERTEDIFHDYILTNSLGASVKLNYQDGYTRGYQLGYQLGYDEGYSAGQTAGYNSGYSAGYEAGINDNQTAFDRGYNDGYQDGYNYGTVHGYDQGYQTGYNVGLNDGTQGATPVSQTVTLLGSIFGAIGTVLSIQLFPGFTLGLLILVPLFFAVLGLILWIWRRN